MQGHQDRSNADLEGAVLEALRRLVEHHSSARAVAERMGQAHNYVARLLRGETKLRLDVLHRVLEALGVSESYLLELLLVEGDRLGGEHVLAFYGGDGAEAEGDFLERYSEQLEAACTGPVAASHPGPSRSREIDELSDRRFGDPEGALAGLEQLIAEALSVDPAGFDASAAGELAKALGTLGTAYRVRGRRTESSAAMGWALRAAAKSGGSATEAEAYQKSAYLLRDLGFSRAALVFLDRASEAFLRAGELEGCARIFVDKAVMWVSLSEFEKARADYQAGLRLLPEEQWRYRVTALSGLAHCYEQLGELESAVAHTTEAERLYGDNRDQTLAFLVWNRANIAQKLRCFEQAETDYQRAMELLDRWSDPQDVALCALDLASLYVRQGKVAELRRLAANILAWLPALRAHRLADGVMMEVIRCAKWGEVTAELLRESRAKIEGKGRAV